MEIKRDENQRSQMIPQTGTKSTVQNPPKKINGVEIPSCGIRSYENCNLTSCNPHPTSRIRNRSMMENHPMKIDGAKTVGKGLWRVSCAASLQLCNLIRHRARVV